jgi:RHS repeat-associated protein
MATGDKYVMDGAFLSCDKGVIPTRFMVTPKPVLLYDAQIANEADRIPMTNILPFGVCQVTRTPCVPAPIMWDRVADTGITTLGARPLLDTSKCMCGVGGKINIHLNKADADAAVALDQQMDKVDEAAEAAEEASGWAFWGGLAMGIGGALLVATGVGAPLGAAMITGAGYLMTASTVLATGAAVAKGVTKFARDPSKEVGLAIVGEVAFEAAKNFVMQKLGGKLIERIARSGLAKRALNSPFAKKMEDRFANAFKRNRTKQRTCLNDPVDVATGNVLSLATDFELPGQLPLVWSRVWYSTSAHLGALGHGWHHSYDIELFADDELLLLRLGDGRYTGTEALRLGESVFIRAEKLTIKREYHGGYIMTDGRGVTHHLAYVESTDSYKLVRIEHSIGQSGIDFRYSAQGFLYSITDSIGRVLEVEHNYEGQLLAIHAPHPTEPRKSVCLVRYAYDAKQRLIRVTDALQQSWQYGYRGGLLTKCTYKNGVTFHYEYDGQDAAARCVHVWGDEGFYADRLTYNLEANQTIAVNSVAAHRVFEYDPDLGVVTRLFDGRGGLSVTEYNEYGEIVSKTDPLGNETHYEYDERGNCLLTELPDGARLQRQFDEQDRLVLLTDAVGGQWHWVYNDAGQLAERRDSIGRTVRYAYSNGRLSAVTDLKTGHTSTLTYDDTGNLLGTKTNNGQQARWLSDYWGRVYKTVDVRGNVQWREYDLLNRVTTVHEPDGNLRRFRYDALNNIIQTQDHRKTIHYAYRGLSCLIRRVEDNIAVEFLYDSEGRLRALVNEHGLTYRFELDAEGDVLSETGFDGLTRIYQRDIGGRIAELTLPNGHRTRYTYDRASRVSEVTYADGRAESYRYREDGALLEATNDVLAVSFKRDLMGLVLQETQGEHLITSRYDESGNRLEISSSLGAHISTLRNDYGAVEHMKSNNWQVLFERDAQGLELQRTLSGGIRTYWKRDQLGRATEQHIRSSFTGPERVRTYIWEGYRQLTHIQDNQHGLIRFEHDTLGNLTATHYPDGRNEFRSPDAVGNLFNTPTQQDRRYGLAGQLLISNGTRYFYDELGNLSRKVTPQGQEWTYSWHPAGHLAEVVRPDGKVVRFSYDALGRRISKTYEGRVTRWVWDGNRPLHEWSEKADSKEKEASITWLFEEDSLTPVGKIQGELAYSVVTDHLGTPLQMHDQSGQITWAAELNSYGKVLRQQGQAQACPFRYPGQYEDEETGLYYNRFRYYDPETGIYISQDPIGLLGGGKFYSYVKDPLSLVDLFGLVVTYGPLDALGRPTGIFAELTIADLRPTGSSTPTIDPPGWLGGAHPHHQQRSHLLADTLGGSGSDARNLVTLTDGSNHPGMSSVEGGIRRHIQQNPTSTVLLEVKPHYNGNDLTPERVSMYAIDQNGNVLADRSIANGLRQNTSCRGSGC